jgi:hypothetical protein
MIELKDDQLVFTFPDVHPQARLNLEFQRTLRIPDDGKTYPLPPGLGRFPLRHVDDHAAAVPPRWLEHGGVLLPMYQSEALWIRFVPAYLSDRHAAYPFAIKVATGKIDAVTGRRWSDGLHARPQDYLVAPRQPWLDGYCVKKGQIRQFVAMPLGAGYSAEEQLTGQAEHGGLQIAVYPMKREVFERRFPVRKFDTLAAERCLAPGVAMKMRGAGAEMGLAPGGRMRQKIYQDPFDFDDWETGYSSRCFVHIANSLVWRAITGQEPPTTPPTAKQYTQAGLPWFDYYDDKAKALGGSPALQSLKSVWELGQQKGDVPLPENDSVAGGKVVNLGPKRKKGQVREGTF